MPRDLNPESNNFEGTQMLLESARNKRQQKKKTDGGTDERRLRYPTIELHRIKTRKHFTKWTLGALHLLNDHISSFDKICSICCENHIHILKVWLESILPLLEYIVFF